MAFYHHQSAATRRRHSGRRAGATPRTGSGWQGRTAPRGGVPPAAA